VHVCETDWRECACLRDRLEGVCVFACRLEARAGECVAGEATRGKREACGGPITNTRLQRGGPVGDRFGAS
jgi:hypothetical protein